MTATAGEMRPPLAPVMSQTDVENVKKCKNFFSTLLRLASQQPAETLNTIKKLIQNLVVRWTTIALNALSADAVWKSAML